MRKITLIIIHCSATPEGRNLDFETCRHDHIHHRGFKDIGYHSTSRATAGFTADARWSESERTARTTTGILSASVMKGPVCRRHTADTRTLEQKATLLALLRELRAVLPEAIIVGHRDLNPLKGCPCFDAVKEYEGL